MMTASARTHAGRVRPQNEDAAVCRPEHGLFAVIDGMGGQEAGEVAAAIAAAAIAEVPNLPKMPSETVLATAMREARKRILAQAEKDPGQRDMGAVATAVRLEDNGRHIGVAHVGDTRAWLVSGKGVRQLTHDHVAPAEDGAAGKRPVARDLGRKNMEGEWVETARFAVSRGDLLVLASDGLHDAVGADELAAEFNRLWRHGGDADAISARLIALALARGAPDNVTVVAVRIGRFTRGKSRRRLGPALTVGLFLSLAVLLGVTLYSRRTEPVVLPDHVSTAQVISAPAPLSAEAGKTTTVAPGTTLTLRGVHVQGADWTIEVGEGASLTLDLTAVDLAGGFAVLLAKGASLTMTDTRVDAGGIRVASVAADAVTLRHATLRTKTGDGPSFEGPAVVTEDDARRLGAPPPPEPAPPAPEKAP